MFPIPFEQALRFIEIADYWSREKPSASARELRDTISKAWWRGELVAANGPSRVHVLKTIYSKCADHIAFAIPGAPEPQCSRLLDDGGVEVYRLVTVPLPNARPDTWIDANCGEAFNAIAEAWHEKAFDLLALEVPFIVLTRSEFIQWIDKYKYERPTFWGRTSEDEDQQGPTNETVRRNSLHTPKKSWKAKAGKKLTPCEEAVLKAISDFWPDGRLAHKAKHRDELINKHLANSGKVAPRTIQRTLRKIEFA